MDVRCPRCDKLLVKVARPASVTLDLRCTRCRLGWATVINATTGSA